ncbi:MAG: oligopeptide ABC transporter ATP-binding protein [Anaerolinea sp.]|nr:oligopeptide ABC transporter ATP-binding protein [Anaerolinea sp.]
MTPINKITQGNAPHKQADRKSTAGDQLLKINDLHVWFEMRKWGFRHAGFVRAVDGVTFNLRNNETIAIVGESGCGKTSLMRTILLLNRPTKGEVSFEGAAINNLKANDLKNYRSHVGYVQQDPYGAMPPFMNIQNILEEPLKINGVKDATERFNRVKKALEEVKMSPAEEFMAKFPHQLSGGQQQRVVIARAMIMEPQLLIADEPVSMLDASVRVEILKLLRGLQNKHNLGVIYITHDLSTVRYFSEQIFVMYAGQVVERGNVKQMLQNTKHPYTFALLEATSDPDANNAIIQKEVPPGEPPSLVNPPAGCRFHPRCPHVIQSLCEVEEPPEFEPEAGHRVKCWLLK